MAFLDIGQSNRLPFSAAWAPDIGFTSPAGPEAKK